LFNSVQEIDSRRGPKVELTQERPELMMLCIVNYRKLDNWRNVYRRVGGDSIEIDAVLHVETR